MNGTSPFANKLRCQMLRNSRDWRQSLPHASIPIETIGKLSRGKLNMNYAPMPD